jgi:deoxyadenosine/deoxycytidine kinase
MVLFIIVDGIIGSGKSTILKELEKRGHTIEMQPVEKWTLLEPYYKNAEKYAMPLQIQIIKSYNDIIAKYKNDRSKKIVFLESCSFASMATFGIMLKDFGVLTQKEITELKQTIEFFAMSLYIYIDVSPQTALKRIKMRDRKGESAITEEYLEALMEKYKLFLKKYDDSIVTFTIDNNKDNCVDIITEAIFKRITDTPQNKYDIAIEGNIGSGKTTLGKLLSNEFHFVEQVLTDEILGLLQTKHEKENPYKLQEAFIKMYNAEGKKASEKNVVCWEGVLSVVPVFTKLDCDNGVITQNQMEILELLYQQLKLPSVLDFKLVVLLQPSIEVIMERIKKRGRVCEKSIDIDRINKIKTQYKNLAKMHSNFIIIDNSKMTNDEIYDFV